MKYYHKYKEVLEANGYSVDEQGYVWDARGDQSAGEAHDGHGLSTDPDATASGHEQGEERL